MTSLTFNFHILVKVLIKCEFVSFECDFISAASVKLFFCDSSVMILLI